MVDVLIRAPRAGDGDGLARSWLDAGAYYAHLNPDLFQIPQADGLAQSFEEWLLSMPSEDAYALVAEKDRQVVGFITAAVERPIESPLSVPFYEQRMGYSRRALRFRKELM